MGGKSNSKPNPIPNSKPNLKIVGEKPSSNPNPQDPKLVDIRPEPDPLPSLLSLATPRGHRRRIQNRD
jgi:hypothetical protein